MTDETKSNICLRCGKPVSGDAPAVCEQCAVEGYAVCQNCGIRVNNGTTPYCDICAEEIVGAG